MINCVKVKLLLALLIVAGQIFSQSQSIHVKVLTRDDGIASNRVNCIYEDQTGFIWLGTQDGLNRYAGDNIETFQNNLLDTNSLINNGVNTIVEEVETGNLWVGTQNGLSYLDRKTYTFKHYFQNTNGNINSLCYDRDNTLWIAADFGLFRSDNKGKFIQYKHDPDDPKSINSDAVSALSLDNLGNLWIGTDKGLDLYEPQTNSFSHHIKTEGLSRIISIYSAANNDVWIGTYFNGLFQMRQGTFKSEPMKRYNKTNGYLINDRVLAICEDLNNNLFVADREGGLIHINLKTNVVQKYTADIYDPNSLNSNALRSMTMSSSGILWIGTYNSGINIVDNNRKPFKYYGINFREDGLFNNNVRSMFEDSEGNIWIGTKDGGGLSNFDREKGTFIHYKYNPNRYGGLQDDYIFQINELDKRHLLIATYQKGLAVYDKYTNNFKHYLNDPGDPSSIVSNKVYTIYIDVKGTIWVGNFDNSVQKGSLQIFHPKTGKFTRFDHVQNVRAICNHDENNLWLGTYNSGMYMYNIPSQKLTPFNPKIDNVACISSKNITSIKKDEMGNVWIGTDGGGLVLIEAETEKCLTYKESEGLPNNRVLGIEIDRQNNVWVSTGNGLAKFDRSTGEFIRFDKNDGLQGNEFETYVSAKTKKGELLFGGRNGFNIFDPEKILLNQNIPEIVFTGFKLFYKPVEIGAEGSPLSKHISLTEEIELDYTQTVITLEFIALNFSSPEKNQYKYRLEGYDNEWIELGNKHEATYANLPAGKYVFKVQASNNDGIWNEEGASMKIKVLAPWWKTWWFRIPVGVALLFITLFVITWRTRAMRKSQLILEKKVKQATEDVELRNRKLEEAQAKLAVILDDVKTQLGSASVELLEATNKQASSIEEISTSVEQMSSDIEDNAAGASQMLDNAKNIAKESEVSVGVVNQTLHAMEDITEEIGFISDFAQMTNILSINATIEAARAGEQGKSFAVVANQVKELADQSQKVAVKIAGLSSTGISLSKDASNKMTELQEYIQSILESVTKITQSSQSQSIASGKINSTVQEVSTHVKTTAELAGKLDEAIKSLNV